MSEALRETSRDYGRPYRPRLVHVYDAISRSLARVGVPQRLDADALMSAAKRRARCEGSVDQNDERALRQLVDALEREASLTPMGRMMTRQRLLGGLEQRLRARALFEQRPEILAAEPARPVFVVGLQRSGTTLLQRLLAQVPGARSMPVWEALEPVPPPGFVPGQALERNPRLGRARWAERWVRWHSPDLFAVHPMDAAAPEEDIVLMDHCLLTTLAEVTYRVPSYASWVEQQDQTPAYRWLSEGLRLLGWQRPGKFWVLKTPHHLEWLDVLFAVFPDAVVIQTHRDPSTTVASFCSMVAHLRGMMSDRVDPLEVGEQIFGKIGVMIDKAMASREARGGRGFVDVHYEELIADPYATLVRVCEEAKLPDPGPEKAAIERWLATNTQHQHGVHRYAAEDFGLRQAELRERFAAYRERFGIA